MFSIELNCAEIHARGGGQSRSLLARTNIEFSLQLLCESSILRLLLCLGGRRICAHYTDPCGSAKHLGGARRNPLFVLVFVADIRLEGSGRRLFRGLWCFAVGLEVLVGVAVAARLL